jgi:DNA-binding NarL/FixJ family response regulator
MDDRIRVLIVDDHQMFADAIEALLATKDDVEIVGIASSGEEALEKCRADVPDVVLMDLDFPGIDGIQATRSITREHPECKVVIVTASRSDEAVAQSIEAGAIGYVPKTEAADRLVDAVRLAVAGRVVVPEPGVMDALRESRFGGPISIEPEAFGRELTKREVEVLQLLAEGKGLEEAAAALGLSRSTVRDYLTMAMGRLGARSRLEAVLMAIRRGLVAVRSRK